jgi:peptidoglycan biosynthesis protein MviN/MurJ (putative lipid II flippase)
MNYKVLAVCGLLAPLLYVFTVVLGGIVTPNYSHASSAISELIETGASYKTLLDPLFDLYNILIILFAVGVYHERNTRRSYTAGTLLLAATGVAGLIMTLFFPQDPRGTPLRFAGQMHIALAGVESACTIVLVLLMGLAFRGDDHWSRFSTYSLVTSALIIVTGAATAIATAQASEILGLLERCTIGLFLLWVFVVAARSYQIVDYQR